MRLSVDDAFFEHDGAQSDDMVCLGIDPQALADGTKVLINTIYQVNIYDHDIPSRH